jgi:hypothetical protein
MSPKHHYLQLPIDLSILQVFMYEAFSFDMQYLSVNSIGFYNIASDFHV